MFVTFADRQRAAPLSIKAALSTSVSTEDVTSVAGEVDNIIEVELAAIGTPVGRVARVTTSYSWKKWRRAEETGGYVECDFHWKFCDRVQFVVF